MARLLNPVTGVVEDIDDALAPFMDELWARLGNPGAHPSGLTLDGGRHLAATANAARAVAPAPAQGQSALRGGGAAARAVSEAVTARGTRQPAPAPRRTPPRLLVPWQPARLARIQAGLPARYRLFTDLGATLGLRQGEAFGCCLEDFTPDLSDYRVRQQVKRIPGGRAFAPPKHERERTVPVPPDLRDRIRQHLTAHGAARVTLPWAPAGKPRTRTLLLVTLSGTSLDRAYFGRLFDTALTGAGIELTRENKTHMLRHLAASRWIAAGADVLMVSDLLGHSDLATTQAYIKRLKTHDQRTRRMVARAQPKTPRPAPAPLPVNVIGVDFATRARRSP